MKKLFPFILSLLLVLYTSLHVNANNTITTDNNDNLSHVIDFEDGGKDYVYIINGIENHCLVPPEGFNPLTASDKELARYCFQPRPTEKSELLEWENIVKHYKTTPTPKLQCKASTSHIHSCSDNNLSTSTRSSITSITSDNWSGYISNLGPAPSNTYSQIQMNYTHPTMSSGNYNCYNSYWVGIGGFSSNKLVQAGTATSNLGVNYAWYQYISDSDNSHMQIITSLVINPNDAVHVYISFEKENDKFTYYIANNTTGKSASGYVILDADSYYDGSSAEWIVERCKNATTGSNMCLGNYNTITLSNCAYKFLNNPSWYAFTNSSTLYRTTMTNSKTILSQPGTPFGGSCFTCTWQNYS